MRSSVIYGGVVAKDFEKESLSHVLPSFRVSYKYGLSVDEVHQIVQYLMLAKEGKLLVPLFNKIVEEFSEYREDIMNYAEELQQMGRQEGRQEGRHDEKLEIARNLKKMRISTEDIVKATGLTREEVLKLK